MTAREFIENLAPENSYWKINEGDLERLNEVAPTAENLYMVFECARCSSGDKNVFHAIPYTALKLDEDGFHNVYCGGMCVDFVDVDAIPTEEVPLAASYMETMDNNIDMLETLTPFDIMITMLVQNIYYGVWLSLFTALFVMRREKRLR